MSAACPSEMGDPGGGEGGVGRRGGRALGCARGPAGFGRRLRGRRRRWGSEGAAAQGAEVVQELLSPRVVLRGLRRKKKGTQKRRRRQRATPPTRKRTARPRWRRRPSAAAAARTWSRRPRAPKTFPPPCCWRSGHQPHPCCALPGCYMPVKTCSSSAGTSSSACATPRF